MPGKSPQNIFKLNRGGDRPEVFNWKLWFAVVSFGIMGAARGLDEGMISGTISKKSFQTLLHLDKLSAAEFANVKGNIAAMVQIGSVAGAGLAFILCDRIGRLWATRQLCILWIIGIVLFLTNNGRLGQVYAGRFIAGLGIGQTTVVAPVYLSEVSPKSIRGLCSCVFAGSVYLGIMLAYFANYGTQIHLSPKSNRQWIIPTTLHIMFAGIIFILTFFNRESPRYLIKKRDVEGARQNLSILRGLPGNSEYVEKELAEMQHQLAEEQEATLGQGWIGYLKEMFLVPANFYRIYLGLCSQLLSQWSGASSITVYAPDFFALLGTTGQTEQLFATAILGIVKFVAAIICALFLVDLVGRKRSLGTGIALQGISILYIAIFFSIVPYARLHSGHLTASQRHASTGAIVMLYFSGFGWAMGWNSIQYLINAEIYPLRIRAVSSSLVMCFHFANQYGNSRAVPSMLLTRAQGGIGAAGTFWFFSVMTALGGLWAWFFIPETSGRSLESMDRLFQLRWWQIGRRGEKEARVLDEQAEIDLSEEMKMNHVNHEENAGHWQLSRNEHLAHV